LLPDNNKQPIGIAGEARRVCGRGILADTIIAALRERAMLAKPAPTWTDLDREIL